MCGTFRGWSVCCDTVKSFEFALKFIAQSKGHYICEGKMRLRDWFLVFLIWLVVGLGLYFLGVFLWDAGKTFLGYVVTWLGLIILFLFGMAILGFLVEAVEKKIKKGKGG